MFQPHLYSRTRDFAAEFAAALDIADEAVLVELYPAREEPIEGISEQTIARLMANPRHTVLTKKEFAEWMRQADSMCFSTSGRVMSATCCRR
mgnify:CR=1 FL=1